jgi:hypothetical protein
MIDHAIMLYDVCHVIQCYDGPCHHAVVMFVTWSHVIMGHAIMLCRDVCNVVPCHAMLDRAIMLCRDVREIVLCQV